jgi:uncharacterized protein with HEPN domain
VKSQRADVEHVLACIDRISVDSTSGRDAVFGSHTLQDAIVRNLQVLCESVRRIDAVYRNEHAEIDWKAIAGMRNVLVHDYFRSRFRGRVGRRYPGCPAIGARHALDRRST